MLGVARAAPGFHYDHWLLLEIAMTNPGISRRRLIKLSVAGLATLPPESPDLGQQQGRYSS